MASFVITARANPPDATLVRALGDCVPGGIGPIADCLRSGAPLFEAELSGRPEQFARVRKLLAVLEGNRRRASWARYPFDPQCGLMIDFLWGHYGRTPVLRRYATTPDWADDMRCRDRWKRGFPIADRWFEVYEFPGAAPVEPASNVPAASDPAPQGCRGSMRPP